MSDLHFKKIYTGNFAIVKRMVMELNALGINPIVKDQAESAIMGGFGGSLAPDFQQIYVHQDELIKATKAIDSIIEELDS